MTLELETIPNPFGVRIKSRDGMAERNASLATMLLQSAFMGVFSSAAIDSRNAAEVKFVASHVSDSSK